MAMALSLFKVGIVGSLIPEMKMEWMMITMDILTILLAGTWQTMIITLPILMAI